MKLKFFAVIFAMVLLLAGCGKAEKIKTSVDDLTGKATVTDLGVSSQNDTTLISNARNPWDIAVIGGEIYTAVGDYGKSCSPIAIYKYDNTDKNWVSTGSVEQEAIIRFLNLNGKSIAIGADPAGRPEYAENYVLNDGKWEAFIKIEGALHTFDAEYFDNSYYFGVSYDTDKYPVVKYDPQKDEYTNIPLYKDGTDVILATGQMPNIKYRRVYDLFCVNERLYCGFNCFYADGNTSTIEFFELKDGKFEFCNAFKASGMKMKRPIKNQILFNSSAVMGDSCYLSSGNLYKTDDFISFNQIAVPEGECVTDLFVDKKGDSKTLFVLTAVKNDNGYKNTVYWLNGESLTEIYSFEHATSALSFAKSGRTLYIGLGGDGIESAEIGKVLKIDFE